ncbi:MAG: hypothetical protein WD844_05115 [Thermoleophilaceae bacterium]
MSAVATLLLPFLIGLWIGHPAFAAAAFLALGVTLLIQQLRLEDGDELLAGMVLASLVSAVAAGFGGAMRERVRHR